MKWRYTRVAREGRLGRTMESESWEAAHRELVGDLVAVADIAQEEGRFDAAEYYHGEAEFANLAVPDSTLHVYLDVGEFILGVGEVDT